MKLDIVRDEADFLALKPVWDALLEQSATRTPFMRWDWVWLWWEEFKTDFVLTIAVVRDERGAPLAIAPLIIGRECEGMRRHLRHLGFLGGLGEVKGERMDFLVPAGREAELTPMLCRIFRALEGQWQAVRLNKLPEESPNHAFIIEALQDCSTGTGIVTRTECSCIRLAPSWTEFEAGMAGKRRRDLRRRMELLKKEKVAQEKLVATADLDARLDEFAALHGRHYPEGVSSFLKPRAWSFHRKLAQKWLTEGRAILPYIEVDSAMAGAIYGFIEGEEFLFFQIGWDPDFARYSMGHLGIRWAAECCMDRGVTFFDMLPGTYRYKTDWAQTSRHVLDVEAYQPESLRATAFQAIRSLKRLFPQSSSSQATTPE